MTEQEACELDTISAIGESLLLRIDELNRQMEYAADESYKVVELLITLQFVEVGP